MSLVLKADPIWDSRVTKGAAFEKGPLEGPVDAGLGVDGALAVDAAPGVDTLLDDKLIEPPSKRLVTWS
jgi:hypothetical protein